MKTLCKILIFSYILIIGFSQQGPGFSAYKEGMRYMKNEDCATAIQYFDEAIELEPKNYIYYISKGQCLLIMRDYEEAKQVFVKAAQVNKNFVLGYFLAGKIAYEHGNNDEAIEYFNKAYEFERDLLKKLKYKLLVIKLLIIEGMLEEAREELEKLKQDMPAVTGDIRVIEVEGDIYLAEMNYEKAIEKYKQILAKIEGLGDTDLLNKYYLKLGIAYRKAGYEKLAEKTLSKIKETKKETRDTREDREESLEELYIDAEW